jgi:hypothetical protein
MSRRERRAATPCPRVQYRQTTDLPADEIRRRLATVYGVLVRASARRPGSPSERERTK